MDPSTIESAEADAAIADRPIAFSDELDDALAELPEELAGLSVDDALGIVARVHGEHLVRWVEAPKPVARPSARLVVAGRVIDMSVGDEVVVGRRGELVVDHPLVSRRHVEIRCGDEGLVVRDLNSANGTWILRAGTRHAVDATGSVLAAGDGVVTVNDHELFSVSGATS